MSAPFEVEYAVPAVSPPVFAASWLIVDAAGYWLAATSAFLVLLVAAVAVSVAASNAFATSPAFDQQSTGFACNVLDYDGSTFTTLCIAGCVNGVAKNLILIVAKSSPGAPGTPGGAL